MVLYVDLLLLNVNFVLNFICVLAQLSLCFWLLCLRATIFSHLPIWTPSQRLLAIQLSISSTQQLHPISNRPTCMLMLAACKWIFFYGTLLFLICRIQLYLWLHIGNDAIWLQHWTSVISEIMLGPLKCKILNYLWNYFVDYTWVLLFYQYAD